MLIDANTLDSIDPEHCFSTTHEEICKLKYWDKNSIANSTNWTANSTTVLFQRRLQDMADPYVKRIRDYPCADAT